MAISGTTIWECQTGGSDSANGGGFDPANTSMATDLAATSATGVSPVVTSASYNFDTRDVGHWLYVKAGTNWLPGWYKIASVSSGAATIDATIGHAVSWNGASSAGPTTVAGCATTASPTGGTWSIDYSQGTAIAFTDMVIDGTTNTKFTSSLTPVGKNFVGNVISVTSGTGFTVQRVQIASVTTTTATCDKSLGTLGSTGGNGGLGGPLASPGQSQACMILGGIQVCAKAGTYTLGNGTANTAGNAVSNGATATIWSGYQTVRGDFGTKPVFQANANSMVLLTISNFSIFTENIEFSPNGHTGVTAMSLSFGNGIINACKSNGCAVGFTGGAGSMVVTNCEASGASSGAGAFALSGTASKFFGCTAHGGSIPGFKVNTDDSLFDCISYANSASGFETGNRGILSNCVAYGNTGATTVGFNNAVSVTTMINCASVNNGKYGYSNTSTGALGIMYNCAAYGNGTAAIEPAGNNFRVNVGFITCTADPFTNGGSGDFTLNSTSGGGPLLKGLGWPATFPGLSPTNYPSVGAYQPTAAAAGGTPHLAGRGGGLAG